MMECNRRCDKKRKLDSANLRVKEFLKDYTHETSKNDLFQFMKIHGGLASATADLERAREDIRTCEGTEYCKT